MLWACILQYYIYKSPPNSIDVWIQAPAYVFGALSEIFVIITGLEVAFLKAPADLRVLVSSIFWMAIAAGAALGIALSPVSKDPLMVWTYAGLSCGVFLAGCAVLVCFRHSIKGEVPVVINVEGQDPSGTTAELAGRDGTDPLAAKVA
jgi:POT family proton-dependent oligopeptide transporter